MRGIKHNTVSQIHSFRQKDNEKVREAALRFKQYIERCPPREKPQEDRQVVLFIEGIRNEHLKKDLHLKKCTTLDEATREVVYLVDNCQIYGEASKDSETPSLDLRSSSSDNKSVKSNQSQPAMDTEKLANELMKRLNQNVRLQNQRIPPMRRCMTCGGDHPTH